VVFVDVGRPPTFSFSTLNVISWFDKNGIIENNRKETCTNENVEYINGGLVCVHLFEVTGGFYWCWNPPTSSITV
jgi:hypothetical protein